MVHAIARDMCQDTFAQEHNIAALGNVAASQQQQIVAGHPSGGLHHNLGLQRSPET